MAKAKFDRSDVVAAATELFWRKGYNCASMQDVFRATGLQPGSLYNAFGNKEGLYEESVRFYGAQAVKSTEEKLASHADVLQAIALSVIDSVNNAQLPSFKSCMLVKSLLELNSMSNDRLIQVVNDQIAAVERVFITSLEQVFEPAVARQRASELLQSSLGINVFGFTQPGRDQMITNLRSTLPWLPWDQALAAAESRESAAPEGSLAC